jgi:DNA-binding response OmpR family regulator
MASYRILYADNNPDARSNVKSFLEECGYIVDTAKNPEDTIQKFLDRSYDLAIIDLRLRNDEDVNDKSGLQIAKTEARHIPKLIYTKFPSFADATKALKFDLEDLPPAVDFVDKGAGLKNLRISIEEAIRKYLKVNIDLIIIWLSRYPVSFSQIATSLCPKITPPELVEFIDDVEFLFRKLFLNFDQISIVRQIWLKSEISLLQVNAFRDSIEENFLVMLGENETIEKIRDHYREEIPSSYSTTIPTYEADQHSHFFMAICWTLKGINLSLLKTGERFVFERSDRWVKNVITNLFNSYQDIWWQIGRKEIPGMDYLKKFFDPKYATYLDRDRLEEITDHLIRKSVERNILPVYLTPQGLILRYPERQDEIFPNPITFIFDDTPLPPLMAMMFTENVSIDLQTLLVDGEGSVWNLDFGEARQAFVKTPFTSLESDIRFNYLESDDLFTLIDFEEQLLGTTNLSESIPLGDVVQKYRKHLRIIQLIRQQAFEHLHCSLGEYYTLLLLCTAARLQTIDLSNRLTRQELYRGIHQLYHMSMLCKFIASDIKNLRGDQNLSIRIDIASRRVWIANREKKLTPTQFDIMRLLQDKRGDVCTREEILDEIFNIPSPLTKSSISMINTHIGRLRDTIEPNPRRPIFIKTVRGKGYRLDLEKYFNA